MTSPSINLINAGLQDYKTSDSNVEKTASESSSVIAKANSVINSSKSQSSSSGSGLPSARLGDMCTGHGPWPARANVSASEDVFINGKGAHRVGDAWGLHCFILLCHTSTLAAGSSSVFVNGKPLGRVGDSVCCNSSVATGSEDVMAG